MEPSDVLTRAADLPDAVVRYGDHAEAVVDLFLPSRPVSDGHRAPETPEPGAPGLVVLVHGGFWRDTYDRRHVRPLAVALAAAGFVVAAPEYRRTGATGDLAGGWPTTFDDVRAATSALPELLAGLGVTTAGTTAVGHSAGGHLVLCLAHEEHPPDRVVALAPVGDLRAAAHEHLGADATQALLGGEPEQVPDRYDAADPMTRLDRRPSCEVVVVHGTQDQAVPVAHSRALARRHPYIRLVELSDVEHFALIDPESAAFPAVLAAVRDGGAR